MANRLITWVYENGPKDRSERQVLLALADRADDKTRECFPGLEDIAQRVRLTPRYVRKILRRLEAAGWIAVRTGGGRGGTNAYRITAENPEQETLFSMPGNEKPGTPEQETRSYSSPEPLEPKNPDAVASGGQAAGQDVPLSKQLFDSGVAFLGKFGTPAPKARKLIGRWRKCQRGIPQELRDGDVLAALVAAERKGITDPVAWITARLNHRAAGAQIIPIGGKHEHRTGSEIFAPSGLGPRIAAPGTPGTAVRFVAAALRAGIDCDREPGDPPE